MSDSEGNSVIWISSSSESQSSGSYATCAEDSIDLQLSDNDEICHLIAALAVEEEQAAHVAAQDAPPDTVYEITRPGAETTVTAHWATAGTAQIAGAHVVAQKKRTKKRHRNIKHYVVFIGRPTGVFSVWPEAKAATRGISGNCYQGYATLTQARVAFEYAQERGWIGGPDGQPPIPRTIPVPLDPQGIDAPPLTPLSPSDDYRKYYCVFRGQRPGIYASIVEAHLSAIGIPTALHESWPSITVAREKYLAAVERDEIRVIPSP